MTIRQQGGIFGRNPTFNNVNVSGDFAVDTDVLYVDTASNKVGINTSSPTQALELSGLSGARAAFLDVGSRRWSIGNITGGGTSFSIRDESGSVDILTFAPTTGNATFSGNIIVDSGKGIDFSATAGTGTSELFDDYEEGTWTPEVADAGSGGNVGSAATATGSYVKIGKMVYLNCTLIDIDTTGLTSVNDFFIRGLPYASVGAAANRFDVGSLIGSGGVAFSGVLTPAVFRSDAYVRLVETVSNTNFDYTTVSQITSGAADLYFTLVYEAA